MKCAGHIGFKCATCNYFKCATRIELFFEGEYSDYFLFFRLIDSPFSSTR